MQGDRCIGILQPLFDHLQMSGTFVMHLQQAMCRAVFPAGSSFPQMANGSLRVSCGQARPGVLGLSENILLGKALRKPGFDLGIVSGGIELGSDSGHGRLPG